MGFAAHLRYHWMEPVVYKSILYIPIAIIGGFDAQDVAIVHFFALTVGHLNTPIWVGTMDSLNISLTTPKCIFGTMQKIFPKP